MPETMLSVPEIADLKPIVVRTTRFLGAEEGWEWVALPNCWANSAIEFPGAFDKSAETVKAWFQDPDNLLQVGVGMTPNDAFGDLLRKRFPIDAEIADDDDLWEISEDALMAEMQEARKDSFALLTAYMSAIQSGQFQESNDLSNEIVEEWLDPHALIACLVGLAARFLYQIADDDDMDPIEKLRQVALAFEEQASDREAGQE